MWRIARQYSDGERFKVIDMYVDCERMHEIIDLLSKEKKIFGSDILVTLDYYEVGGRYAIRIQFLVTINNVEYILSKYIGMDGIFRIYTLIP